MSDFTSIISEFSFNEWSLIIGSLFLIIPSIRLFKFYQQTKILEYLLYGGVFIFGFASLALPFAVHTNRLIYWQLYYFSYNIIWFLLILYGTRIKWGEPPKILLAIGIVWFLTLQLTILNWEISSYPKYIDFNFFKLGPSPTYYKNSTIIGAGYQINKVFIYSTSHRYLGDLFRLFGDTIVFYAYLSAEPALKTDRTQKAYRIWIIASFSSLMTGLLITFLQISEIWLLTNLITIGLVVYLTFAYPEAMVITLEQVLRAHQLYENIKDDPNSGNFNQELFSYLSSLPSELFTIEDNT